MPEARTLEHLRERLAYKGMVAGKRAWQRLRPQPPQLHVFVAGMQRSGTNMMMDLLERSRLTDVFHERDPRAFDNYRMRERTVIHALVERSRAPYFIIKALCELDQLTALMDEFAPARTVWVVREYADAVNSALVSFGNFTKQVARIAADRQVDDWRAGGMSEATHALVRRLHHADMSEASAAALIWYFRNVLFFEQGFERDARVRLVAYERLVSAPQAQCREVFEFLGLPYSPWITRNVFASSVGKKRPPAIEPAIVEVCEGLATRFRALAGQG